MESLLTQRMRQRNLTAVGVSNMLQCHAQRSAERGDHLLTDCRGCGNVMRLQSVRGVRNAMRNSTHSSISAIVDVIDSELPPLPPQHSTQTRIGSEERVEVYAQRFARGEALFHCDDISHYNNGEQL